MDDRLRTAARAARAEIESALDVESALAIMHDRAPTFTPPAPTVPNGSPRHRGVVWLAAAAAAVLVLAIGAWFAGQDDAVQTAEPTAPVTTSAMTTGPAPQPTATTPSTSPSTVTQPATGTCTNIKAHDVGAAGIADLIVEARQAGRAPAITGCLEAIPVEFDGSPSRCWSCAGQQFTNLPVRVSETAAGFSFDLAVSTPDGDGVVDVVETWQLDLAADELRIAGVTFADPLVSRADSLATITAYLTAIEAGDWPAAARMLDDGAQSPEERADLQLLELSDYSYEGVAAGLERWCADGCSTERPTAAELVFNGFTHDLVRSGERIRVAWYEGQLSILGLPHRAPATLGEAVDWRTLLWETSNIEGSCIRASLICTQVIHDPDGTPISLDPNTRVLTRHGLPAVSVTLPDEFGERPFLYHAGPDSVVYLQVDPAVPAELAADVVAITLSEADTGREIGRWSGVVDNVGDSELVATRDGLVNVNCCGGAVRPEPGSEVRVPWLTRTGEQTSSTGPSVRVEIAHPMLTVHRDDPSGTTRSWTFRPAGDWTPRGMPRVVPTFDGGFIAAEHGAVGTSIARGFADGSVEQLLLDDNVTFVDALDPAGRFLVLDESGRFARVEPFPDRATTWGGAAEVDAGGTGAIELVEIDAAIDAAPDWASDPVALAQAVSPVLKPNEQRTISSTPASDTDWVVTVTTSNLFDDSVAAVRWELTLRLGGDGLYRFLSGTQSTTCAPGRGHQDFQVALCV